jgi:hypothetical protein
MGIADSSGTVPCIEHLTGAPDVAADTGTAGGRIA